MASSSSSSTSLRALSYVDCSNVYVNTSSIVRSPYCAGAFAKRPFRKGEVVEVGIVRTVECNGHKNPYLFTWSEDRTRWALASGCATFYNCSTDPNTHMQRDFVNNRFVITATRDIEKDEELTHTYRSLRWRKCFAEDEALQENNPIVVKKEE